MTNSDVCASCGRALAINERFCGNCGKENPNFSENSIESPKRERLLPVLFYEMQPFINKESSTKKHLPLSQSELTSILKIFEKGNGASYENAKNILLDRLPLEAIGPLWKMKDKIFLSEEKQKDIFHILGEIGTEAVTKLIIAEPTYSSNNYEYLQIISKNQSDLAIEWLGEMSANTNEFPGNILAMLNLFEYNNPVCIRALAINEHLGFLDIDTDDDFGRSSRNQSLGGMLLSSVIKGVAEYSKQQQALILSAGLATFPDLPMEMIIVAPSKLILHQQSEMCRLFAVVALCKKFGYSNLDKCWPQNSKNSSITLKAFLAGCYLFSGQSNPNLNQVFNDLLTSPLNTPEQISSAIFICNALISAENNYHHALLAPRVLEFFNTKSIPVKNAIAATALYKDYEPLKFKALEYALQFELSFVPSLVFASIFHNNTFAKASLDAIYLKGKKDVREAIDNWTTILNPIS